MLMSTTPAPELPPPAAAPELIPQSQQVANYWHSLIILALMLLLSASGAKRVQRAEATQTPRPILYATTIAVQWTMVGLVWLGIRRRGYTLRQLTGKGWRSAEEALLDIAIAAGFWIGAVMVLAGAARLMRFAPKLDEMRKSLDFLAPNSALELALWVVLACTAGVCEEIVFRGYLQRQFAAMSRSVIVGVLASAVIFGASHAYEGGSRMIL